MTVPFLRPGQIVRARGASWVVQRHVTGARGSILVVCGRGADNRGARTSFLLPYEPIETLPSPDAPRMVRPRTWRRVARSILSDATPSFEALRAPVRANLAVLPFQLEPVLAILRGIAARVLIADEVGLGKTVQAGLIVSEMLRRRPDGRALVVAPAGLRHQWHMELRERFALEATLLDSASIARHADQWNGNPWSIPGVILTSLDYVKRAEVVRGLEALIWEVVVFDEAHALAGRSDRATVAAMLARRARALVLLTATPHSGDDAAFGRLTSLGDFSRQFPIVVFRRTRRDVGMAVSRHTISIRVRLTPVEAEMHRTLMAYARLVWRQTSGAAPGARLAMTVLARRACSSAWSLARSLETRLNLLSVGEPFEPRQVPLPFGDEASADQSPWMELSAPGLPDREEERRWLERVLRLARQAQTHEAKLRALVRLLRRAREPAIVFTEYRDTLDRLASELPGFAPVQLHGGMTSADRLSVLREFSAGNARLLLATDAASEGLNLHHQCRLVVNLELPWTPVRLEQRIGRVERLGQHKRVHAVHLLGADTCEEQTVATLLERVRRVDDVLNGMRPHDWEQEISAAAIGQDEDRSGVVFTTSVDPRSNTAAAPGILVKDLRSSAIAEAERIELARRLLPGNAQYAFGDRPVISVALRRRPRVEDWIYGLVFDDEDGQLLWSTAIGIRRAAGDSAASREAIRGKVKELTAAVELAVAARSATLLASFLAAFGPSCALARERERAIAAGLRDERARLAAALVQPGLFDRRVERAAAAQNATLDEALARCTSRIAELARQSAVTVDRRLVLALLG